MLRQAGRPDHEARPPLLALVWSGRLTTEVFQRCRSRVSTAAEIDDIRFGLHRDLRKIRQDFSRATPRSTGARAVASARLMVCWVGVRSRPGGRLRGVVTHGPAPI